MAAANLSANTFEATSAAYQVCGRSLRASYCKRLSIGENDLRSSAPASARDNVPANVFKQLKQEIENSHD